MTTKSDLKIRINELQTLAIETFGSESMANAWLNKENFVLGSTPILIAETDSGLIEIKKILSAISYGGVV